MKDKLEVYSVGSKVKLAEDVYGTIVSINISDNNYISYECGWWNGRSYTKDRFSSHQIQVCVGDKVRIGFA